MAAHALATGYPGRPDRRTTSRSPAPVVRSLLGIAALCAWLLTTPYGPWRDPAAPFLAAAGSPRIAYPAPLAAVPPPVEPVVPAKVAPASARMLNDGIPFSTEPVVAARPFVSSGSEADRDRALDCLAAAAFYEAGDDPSGAQAVAQAVLNRVRHPAFPRSVCAVVFQGADRRAGCQFTFTCDGAMARVPGAAAWTRARLVARMALSGHVDPRVGHATHYHTDWVHPYWSGTLHKTAAVDTHLFFRWPGRWGQPDAFGAKYAGVEPLVPRMARLSVSHRSAGASAYAAPVRREPVRAGEPVTAAPLGPSARERLPARTAAPDADTFLATLDERDPATFPALARRSCGDRAYCRFVGWTDPRRNPHRMPIPGRSIDAISFSFLRTGASRRETVRWSCAEFPRDDATECLRRF